MEDVKTHFAPLIKDVDLRTVEENNETGNYASIPVQIDNLKVEGFSRQPLLP